MEIIIIIIILFSVKLKSCWEILVQSGTFFPSQNCVHKVVWLTHSTSFPVLTKISFWRHQAEFICNMIRLYFFHLQYFPSLCFSSLPQTIFPMKCILGKFLNLLSNLNLRQNLGKCSKQPMHDQVIQSFRHFPVED